MGKKGKRIGEKAKEGEMVGAEKYLNEIETGDSWDNRHALYQRAVQVKSFTGKFLTSSKSAYFQELISCCRCSRLGEREINN